MAHEPVPAVCDPERVAQILRILIDNAIAHTPRRDRHRRCSIAGARSGRRALAVRDFGPGIAAAARERIFEPFYTSDEGQGSGLGLAIAHELAERMRRRAERRIDAGAHGVHTGAADIGAALGVGLRYRARVLQPVAVASKTLTDYTHICGRS